MLPWKARSRSENIAKPINADRSHQNSASQKPVQLSSHHSRIIRAGPQPSAGERRRTNLCRERRNRAEHCILSSSRSEARSPAHSIDIYIAPVLETRTVQQGASLFVRRFVGECIHLRSACREEPKKSTVGFSGQVPNQAQVREDGQTYAEKAEPEHSIVF